MMMMMMMKTLSFIQINYRKLKKLNFFNDTNSKNYDKIIRQQANIEMSSTTVNNNLEIVRQYTPRCTHAHAPVFVSYCAFRIILLVSYLTARFVSYCTFRILTVRIVHQMSFHLNVQHSSKISKSSISLVGFSPVKNTRI